MKSERERIDEAVALAVRYGGIPGDHHKAWVIDQMVRALAGDDYEAVVADARAGADGPETYGWEVGIAP
jgi:predicted alpha/beta-fold hydrolase